MSDPATLDSINDALFAALGALGPAPGSALFQIVGFIAEEPTLENLQAVAAGDGPAALLYWEGSDPLPELTIETLAGGLEQACSRSTWRVYVIIPEPRGGTDAAIRSVPGQPGALKLCTAVATALAGLAIEGLEGDRCVSPRGRRPLKSVSGQLYGYVARFSADHVDEQADADDGLAVPLTDIVGDINLASAATRADDPTAPTDPPESIASTAVEFLPDP